MAQSPKLTPRGSSAPAQTRWRGLASRAVALAVGLGVTACGGTAPPSTFTTNSPVTTSPYARLPTLATIALAPPDATGAGSGTAREVSQKNGGYAISIVASGVAPNTTANAYAVWLYRGPGDETLLGFVDPPVGPNGMLRTAGVLPKNASHFDKIMITRETNPHPTVEGPIVLEGSGRIL